MPTSCSSSSSLVVNLRTTKIGNLGVNFPVNLYIELFKLLLILIDLTVMLIICVLKVSGSTCSLCLGFMLKCSCRKGKRKAGSLSSGAPLSRPPCGASGC